MILAVLSLLLAAAPVAERPQLVLQQGHSDGVYQAAFSKDGKKLVSSGLDHAVRVWDIGSGLEIGSFEKTDGSFSSLALSTDGKYAMAGKLSDDGKVWTVADGKVRCELSYHLPGTKVFATSDNRFAIVAGGGDLLQGGSAVQFVDPATCAATRGFLSPAALPGTALQGSRLLADGRWVALQVGLEKQGGYAAPAALRMVDAAGNALPSSAPFPVVADKYALSPDGRRVLLNVVGAAAGSGRHLTHLELFDTQSGKSLHKLSEPFVDESSALVILADNRRALTADWFRGVLHQWDLETGKELWHVSCGRGIWDLALSSDGQFAAGSQSAGGLFVWDLEAGVLVRSFDTHVRTLDNLALTDNDTKLVLMTQARAVTIWDLVEGKMLRSIPTYSDRIVSMAMAAQRKGSALVLAGKEQGVLNVYDTKTGALTRTLSYDTKDVKGLAFSSDEKTLFCLGFDGGRDILFIIDFESGKSLTKWNADAFVPYSGASLVPLSPDEKQFAYRPEYSQSWMFHDLKTLQKVGETPYIRYEMSPIGFAPLNSRLADNKVYYDLSSKGIAKREIATGREVAPAMVADHFYSALTTTLDGRFLLTSARDGLVRFTNTTSGELVASLAMVDGAEPLIFTPDGYYKAGKVSRGVAFRIGRTPFPFESFDLKLNRPDLVLARLGFAPKALIEVYQKAHQRRLRRMGYTEEMLGDDFTLPRVAVKNEPGVSSKSKQITLEVHAEDSQFNLDRLFVSINGVTENGSGGFDLKAKQSKSIDQSIPIELSAGLNQIQVSVLNARGIESARQSLRVRYQGPAAPARRWLVAIGVSKYQDKEKNLSYAAKDARDLAAALGKPDPGFESTRKLVILNEKATRSAILEAREQLKESKVDDQVIVFYAGHGLLDDKLDYYLATSDINFESPAGRGLPYEGLESLLDGIHARHKILLVDACNSGEIDRESTTMVASVATQEGKVKSRGFKKKATSTAGIGLANSFELMRAMFADLRRGSGAVVISSASGTQFALESSEWKNGVFTYALLDGLKHKKIPLNAESHVTVSKLRDYVIEKVQALTNGQQTPTARQDQLEDDFIIQ